MFKNYKKVLSRVLEDIRPNSIEKNRLEFLSKKVLDSLKKKNFKINKKKLVEILKKYKENYDSISFNKILKLILS